MDNIRRLAGRMRWDFIVKHRIADGMPKVGSNFLRHAGFWNSSSSSSRVDLLSSVRSLSSSAAATMVSSLSSSSGLPCLMMPPEVVSDGDVYKRITKVEADKEDGDDYDYFFSIAEKKVVKMGRKHKGSVRLPWQTEVLTPNQAICFGSSHGWLAYIHPRNCSLYLFNPCLSSFPYLPLPPIETLPFFMSSVRRCQRCSDDRNSPDYYRWKIVVEFLLRNELSDMPSEKLSKNFFHKIALSSSPSPLFSNSDDKHPCTAMAIQGLERGRLAFCRIGDRAWTGLDGEEYWSWSGDYRHVEVVYFSKENKFYTLTDMGDLEGWDLNDPLSPQRTLVASFSKPDVYQSRYLVECSDDLLLVVVRRRDLWLSGENTSLFSVYKIDLGSGELTEAASLGDRVVFVGRNHSVCLYATDFPGLKKNSIYFSPQPFGLRPCFSAAFGDFGVFNLENGSISNIWMGESQQHSVWFVPEADEKKILDDITDQSQ